MFCVFVYATLLHRRHTNTWLLWKLNANVLSVHGTMCRCWHKK